MKTINLQIFNEDRLAAGPYDAGINYSYSVTGDENIAVHLYHMKMFLQSMGYVVAEIACVDRDGDIKSSSEEFYE